MSTMEEFFNGKFTLEDANQKQLINLYTELCKLQAATIKNIMQADQIKGLPSFDIYAKYFGAYVKGVTNYIPPFTKESGINEVLKLHVAVLDKLLPQEKGNVNSLFYKIGCEIYYQMGGNVDGL
jgi:hypothetical protein